MSELSKEQGLEILKKLGICDKPFITDSEIYIAKELGEKLQALEIEVKELSSYSARAIKAMLKLNEALETEVEDWAIKHQKRCEEIDELKTENKGLKDGLYSH